MRTLNRPEPMANLSEFTVTKLEYSVNADWGNWLVRIDPRAGRGYFARPKGEHYSLTFAGSALVEHEGSALPLHVRQGLRSAGYSF